MYLTKRIAKIGNQIPSRGEMHGDESVTALDIPLTDVMLNERELGDIMRQPRAYKALFDDSNGNRAPFFTHIKPIALDEKIEGATVILTHGLQEETIRLVNVKVAKIKLEPCLGGMTAMDCTIQCTPELTEQIAHMLGWINSPVDVEIDGGEFGAQSELPMDTPPDDADFDEVGERRRRVQ